MRNLRIYLLLLSATALITFIHNIHPKSAIAQLIPSSNINENITNTEDLPILQSPIAKNVYDTAKSITVMIRGKGDVIRIGSGVIIAKNAEKYYVLTAEHVFRGFSELEITTPDGKIYPININYEKAVIGQTDSGVLEFTSKENYQVATLAKEKLKDGNVVFTYGFPRQDVLQGNINGLFSIGYIWSQESSTFKGTSSLSFNNGYELAYTNLTEAGISGGPVLDHQGRLVGIHGQMDGEWWEESQDTGTGQSLGLGYSLGIPIYYLFSNLATNKQWKDFLSVDTNFSKDLNAEEKSKLLGTALNNILPPNDQDNAIDWLNYGNKLWRFLQYEQALQAFNQAINLKPNFYPAYYSKGLVLQDLQRYTESIETLETAIKIYNETNQKDKNFIVSCLNWQGNSLRFLEKYEDALKIYEKAIELDNNNFILHFQKGWLLEKLKRYQDSILAYSQGMKSKPHFYIYNNRALIYSEMKEYDKALADFNQAIELNPQYAEIYNNRALMYYEMKEYDKTLADYNQAILINPQLDLLYSNRGNTYHQLKLYEKAIDDFNQSLLLNPKSGITYNNRGNTYSEMGQYERGLADYNSAISLNPQLIQVYYNRANVYRELKQYDKALINFNQAILLNPQYADAYNNRGNIYYGLQQYDKAFADYNKAIQINPENPSTYFNRGNGYRYLGDYQKALVDYNKAIQINPQYAEAYYNRGNLYGQMKRYDKAISDFNQVLKINPQVIYAYYNRGIAYSEIKEYDKALIDFNQAILLNPQYAEAYTNRGLVYYILGEKTKAIADMKKAIQIFCEQGSPSCDLEKVIEISCQGGNSDCDKARELLEEIK